MNLEQEYQVFSSQLCIPVKKPSIFLKKQMIHCLDLTFLQKNCASDAVERLEKQAIEYQTAAICLYPEYLVYLSPLRKVKRAVVLNFPSGEEKEETYLLILEQLVSNKEIDEIDFVFPYRHYLHGDAQLALKQCQKIIAICQKNQITNKIILETELFPDSEQLYQLARLLLDNGCHFLKTSTGKLPKGADPFSVFILLKALSDSNINAGIKISGGIKEMNQAYTYTLMAEKKMQKPIDPSWFRFGASSLLEQLSHGESSFGKTSF